MENYLPVAAFAAFLVLLIGLMYWRFSKSRRLLEEWAERGGYEVLEAERRLLRRGPFWWRTSKGQEVFYVTLRDAQGQVCRAYVRVGGWFLGLLSDKVAVEWDE